MAIARARRGTSAATACIMSVTQRIFGSFVLVVFAGCGAISDQGDDGAGADTASVPIAAPESVPVGTAVSACSGTGCEGKDPAATGCSTGARTVIAANLTLGIGGPTVGLVELRWSDTCETNWSRVTYNGGASGTMAATVVDTNSIGHSNSTASSGPMTIWSPMAYAPNKCERAHGELLAAGTSPIGTTPCR